MRTKTAAINGLKQAIENNDMELVKKSYEYFSKGALFHNHIDLKSTSKYIRFSHSDAGIGLYLTKEQAIDFARNLLVATAEFDTINIYVKDQGKSIQIAKYDHKMRDRKGE